MSEQQASSNTLFGSIYNLGGSIVSYATDTLNSFLGWEDLEIVDPDADSAHKGAEKPDDGINQNERKQAWGTKQFQQYIGMDVTSLLSVPVWIMEPFTILQKAAEIMEYTELLDKANACTDPYERFAWVAAYTVSPFGAAERAWKPFNPILGETFELDIGNGVRYLAEQVSHHPPICAAHAENENFCYDLVSAPTTRFLGNSLEVYPYGRTRLTLRAHNEVYTLVPPNAMVHNIVIGRTWVDVFGPLTLNCHTTGMKCVLNFTPCGWFGYGRHEFKGYVTDQNGVKRIKLFGKWNAFCDMVPCSEGGEAIPDQDPVRMWTCSEKPKGDYYSFTKFAHKLNRIDGARAPLPSDSRRRPDRSALYAGESGMAGAEKHRLEEMQRAERRERDRLGDKWEPRWFYPVENPELYEGELSVDKVPFWQWNGEYLKQPERPSGAKDEDVDGKNFCPWQYSDIHDHL
jgi:hypothetical protein